MQPLAVARRKRPLGTTTSQHGGSRRKAAEHAYGKKTKKNHPAPRSLSFCVESTISLGKIITLHKYAMYELTKYCCG